MIITFHLFLEILNLSYLYQLPWQISYPQLPLLQITLFSNFVQWQKQLHSIHFFPDDFHEM